MELCNTALSMDPTASSSEEEYEKFRHTVNLPIRAICADIRVVLSWNCDMVDMELHVVEVFLVNYLVLKF